MELLRCWGAAMAYSLKGCGVVLHTDIEKRNKDFAKFGRTPMQPVVASLFIHSVYPLHCDCCCCVHTYMRELLRRCSLTSFS